MVRVFHIRVDGLFGGSENIALEYLKRLDRKRFESRLIALVNDGPLARKAREAGVPVDVLPMHSRFDSRAVTRLQSLVREHSPDLLLSYGIRADWIASKVARNAPVRWVSRVPNLTCHDYPNPLVGEAMFLLNRWLIRKADAVIAGARLPEKVLSKGILAPKRVEYIPNGVDFGLYKSEGTDRSFRQSLGISNETRVLACIGRLEPVKGQKYLIEALPKVRETTPNLFLVLAGTGSSESALKELARRCRCEDIVVFPGFVDDVRSLLASTDLYVAPSLHEGMPSAVMEAVAMEVPVVATRVGGHEELMGQWAPELLVPPKNPGELAQRIIEVLQDYPASKRRTLIGREWLMKNQSWDSVIPKLESLLADVAAM